jgi:hypothetical protein
VVSATRGHLFHKHVTSSALPNQDLLLRLSH